MTLNSAIILSKDNQIISVLRDYFKNTGIELITKYDFDDLILELQENDYELIICDCSNSVEKCIQHVKIIKKMRPKVFLVIISDNIDKKIGGALYQEGIFHLSEKPIDKEYLEEIVSAIVAPHKK